MLEAIYTILGVLIVLGLLAFVGWVMMRALKRSDDPRKLIVKWIITALVAGVLGLILGKWGPSPESAFIVPFVCVGLGVILSLVWATSIGDMLARPITALYDGGLEALEAEPLYSTAQAKRKKGLVHEALWEIQQQLEKFPQDITGQMLMADIQADDLKDLAAAQATVLRLCQQPNQPPASLAAALNQLADWHLKLAQDPEGARRTLQEIIDRFPDTPWSYAANQRLAHLGNTAMLLSPHERRVFALPHLEDGGRLGPPIRPPSPSAAESRETEAQEVVKHLEEFPEDNDARQKLAMLYAHHYQRLDLAVAELEQLIAQSQAPPRKIIEWLNLLADWQIELEHNEEAARLTLERIIELYPGHAAAQMAQQRLGRLKLELRKAEASHAVKLGAYEQDMGLKWGRPKDPATQSAPPP